MNKKKNRTNKNRTKRRLQKMKNNTKKKQIRKYRKKKGGMSPNPPNPVTKTFTYAGGTYTGPYILIDDPNHSYLFSKRKIMVPDGYGTLTHRNSEYVGNFKNGVKHGHGKYTQIEANRIFEFIERWEKGEIKTRYSSR